MVMPWPIWMGCSAHRATSSESHKTTSVVGQRSRLHRSVGEVVGRAAPANRVGSGPKLEILGCIQPHEGQRRP
jgi:hypothetical protein